MKNTLKTIGKYLLFIAIAGTLLFLAFKNTDPQQLWQDLKKADYSYVLLSMVMGYVAIVSRGARWLLMLEPLGYKAKFWNSVHSVSVLYIVNLAVPRAGELARCTSMNQVEDIPIDKLFGTVLLERVIDFVMLFLVMGTAFILHFDDFFSLFNLTFTNSDTAAEESSNTLKYIALGGAAVFGLVFLIFRKRIINHPKFAPVRSFLNGVKEGFKTFGQMKRKGAFIGHTLLIWVLYFLMVYVVFFSLDATSHLTLSDGLFIMMAASLGIVVPVPGGWGAYHYFVTMALLVLGVERENGLTFATIVHSSQTLMLLLTGLLAFIFLYFERRKTGKLKGKANGAS
ncbi:MAG: lysylphosphatidylglycerol synthase transmembrane domain-containing protein [Schleiferiaceae bacterium]